ncbi:MAG: amino acid adenylation domain-containing protein, partial [Chloroflexota bacterium]
MKTSAKSALDLSAKKKALLQKMLKQAGGNASPAHLQERSDDWTSACISACSFEQHGQWFLAQLAPGRSSEIQRLVLRLNGLADYSVIQQTVQKLVHRHPILRASFPNQDGMMAYERIPDDMIDITVVDMSHITATNHAFIALLEHYGQMPFDIGKGPLCHITLFHTMDGPVVLFILHTLIADHATLGILQQDFIALYDHLIGSTIVAVPDIAHTYADYVEWQHQYRHSPEFQTHLAYWQQALSDAVLELNLPRDTTRHRPMFDSSTSHSIIIPSDINNQLSMFCQASDIDPEQVFLSVLYLLLYRYTHQSDMILGYLSKNRSTKARQHIVGPCANIVMLRMALSDTLAGTTLLSSVGETLAAIQPYADVPFTCVAEHVYPTHDLSQSPLYQVFFAYYNDVWYGGSGVNTSAQRLSVPLVLRSAPQTVGFIFHTTEHGTTLTCTYDNTQFTQLSITRFQQHYLSLLQTLLCQPEQTITTYPFHAPNAAGLVSTRSEHQCQLEHSTTVVPGTSPVSISIPTSKLPLTSMLYIHQRIEYYAAQNPDALAIVDSTTHLTYQELNTQANQLAHYLMTKGVRSEVLVGVCIERSPMLIVCLLAIVKTGATYLPLDPAYPTERIHVILEDAQAALLLTHGHNIECSDRWQGAIIDLVQLSSTLSAQRSENPSCDFVDHQRAYVIYTSGSTGKPKGVEIEHYSLLNLISWHQSTFVVGEHDRATLIAAPSFDASVWEIWPYLSTGACLHIPDETLRTMPEQLRDWLVDHDITCCFVPTPLAEQLLDLPWPQSTALRYMLTGGDRLHRYPPADVSFVLVNNYGPTECTVVTTSGAVSETSNETHLPTIGPPIANMQAHVLDQYGTEVPIGVVGELYIGGVGVARGYLNRPALTATRFVPNPFSGIYNQQNTESRPSSSVPGSRLYCTGDLVRWLPGEVIEFVGRIDDQVKVRGFRIELGEVEATLSRHPHVKACVVLAHKDTTDATKLVAYVVPQHFEQVTETACSNALDSSASLIPSEFISLLRQHLSSQLPFYMIPALFVVLDVLPMTPHGKIDRQALPLPQSIRSDDTICTLETTTEKLLADLWSKVLQKNICDRADHFFELGGDSLRATQLLAQLQAHFSIQLT